MPPLFANPTFRRLSVILLLIASATLSSASYSNSTLVSNNGDIEVVVYLPVGLKPTEPTYYVGSRFDHGSMIGSIKLKSRRLVDNEVVVKTHELFGGENWRLPHNSQWPESGIGLAAEFGVGDDGAFCQFRCGWGPFNDVTNGVLGYLEARNGEPFLKIGVGALIKGSCPVCDSTDNYRFNSPYEFAELPQWRIIRSDPSVLSMEHEASVRHYGYRLHKDIVLDGNVLVVTSILTNLGIRPFQTAYYSHNFFTCDGIPIRQGYGLDLDLSAEKEGSLYEEPGVIGSWAKPLDSFARVTGDKHHVSIEVTRPLEGDTRIKAEFAKDLGSKGSFTLHGCGASIKSDLPEVKNGELSMYAYNLYLEKGTFSPEPQILIELQPGESKSWSQRLVIEDTHKFPDPEPKFDLRSMSLLPAHLENAWKVLPGLMVVLIAAASVVIGKLLQSSRRTAYLQIPDVQR